MNIFKKKINKGFTLSETLAAVAILIVLMGLISIPIVEKVQNTIQTRLDSMAQTVYVTAQNNLTKLQASGRIGEVVFDDTDSYMKMQDTKPIDYVETASSPYRSLTVMSDDSSKHELLVPDNTVDANGKYIVEYDTLTGDVYAVFYYEEGSYNNGLTEFYADANTLRTSRKERINYGVNVGYYGGHIRENLGSTDKIVSDIIVTNKEILKADFDINMPLGHEHDEIKITITIKGETSGAKKEIIHVTNADDLEGDDFVATTSETDAVRQYSLLIDQLDTHAFADYYPEFYPGENIKISVKVEDLTSRRTASSKSTPEVVSSLYDKTYEDDMGNLVGDIAYVRHLENLNNFDYAKFGLKTGISSLCANQVKDINFNNNKEEEYADIYENRKHTPINNPGIYVYEGNGYYISNISTNNVTDAGLFGTFYGKKLSGIIVVGTNLRGTNAGSLAGTIINTDETNTTVTIDKCYSYLSSDYYVGKLAEENKYVVGTSNAGGLVGKAGDGVTPCNLQISDSFAATVVSGDQYAGGLVGYTKDNLIVNKSYADCYIETSNTGTAGGLAGNAGAGSTFSNCYSAGFLMGDAKNVAGFVPSQIASVTNSYTVFYTLDSAISGKGYTIAVSAGSASKVYYNVTTNLTNNITGVNSAITETIKGLATALGNEFYADTINNSTIAYHMSKWAESISGYPYPTIKLTKVADGEHSSLLRRHYGDWNESIEISGKLAYYEVYFDGSAGFYMPGASKLNEYKRIEYDGYCLVYDGRDYENAITDRKAVIYSDGSGEDTYNTELSISKGKYFEIDGDPYYLRILSQDLRDYEGEDGQFYQKIVVDDTDTYFVNTGFAKTVSTVYDSNAPEVISIRSARHTNYLSKYFGDRISAIPNIKESTFYQERDIDYSSYDWKSVDNSVTSIRSQVSIGNSNVKFASTYNGDFHKISGLSINANTYGTISETGFFGHIDEDATVKNLVISNEDLNNKLSLTVNGTAGYLGTIAAYNEGTIENCVAANMIANINSSNSGTIYAGGLVGANKGLITRSSANIPQINITSPSSAVYAGGFAGTNDETIKYSYALGAINFANSSSGSIEAGGFSSTNDTVQYAYSTTSINVDNVASGSTVHVYGFTPKTGLVTDCTYMNNSYFTYAGNKYRNEFDTSITAGNGGELNNGLIFLTKNTKGFANARYSYDHNIVGSSETFPLVSSVYDKQYNNVHYGEWPTENVLGKVGFYYWEKEGNEYNFHVIDSESEKADFETNDLCTDHDCDETISAYGYGYYLRDEKQTIDSIKFANVNTDYINDGNNIDAVNEALATKLGLIESKNYTFYSYRTGTDYLYPTSADASTLTITTKDGEDFIYSFSPLFANSFVKGTGKIDTYEIRAVNQLQDINFYYDGQYHTSRAEYYSVEDRTGRGNGEGIIYRKNHQGFLYLSYMNPDGSGAVIKNNKYKQTHDINTLTYYDQFVPIGARIGSLNAGVYLGFSGEYDGQGYLIKHLSFKSDSSCTGVFGYVLSGSLKNINLYSVDDIEVAPGTKDLGRIAKEDIYVNGIDDKRDYFVGGIAGYMTPSATIDNCSVAGYDLRDDTEIDTLMTGIFSSTDLKCYIGGVVGYAYQVNNCTSYSRVYIKGKTSALALAGNVYSHAGGIAGAAHEVNNCYIGGTLIELVDSAVESVGHNGERYSIAGIAGGANNETKDVNVNNSYIFLENISSRRDFEDALYKERIISSALIATNAELKDATVNINNCYYLPQSGFTGAGANNLIDSTNEFVNNATYNVDLEAKTYSQLVSDGFVNELNNGSSNFGKVTTDKTYAVTDLYVGKIYQFPAIHKIDNEYAHFGDWPGTYGGMFVSSNVINLDRFTRTNNIPDSTQTITISYYNDNGEQVAFPSKPTVTYSGNRVSSDVVEHILTKDGNNYLLQLGALKNGEETITLAVDGGNKVTLLVNVTGELSFTVEQENPNKDLFETEIVAGDKANQKHYILTVKDTKGELISDLADEDWVVNAQTVNVVQDNFVVSKITSGDNAGKYDLCITAYNNTETDDPTKTNITVKNKNVPIASIKGEDNPYKDETEQKLFEVVVYPVKDNVSITYIDGTNVIHTDENVPFGSDVTELYEFTNEELNGREFVGWVDEDGLLITEIHGIKKDTKLVAKFNSRRITLIDHFIEAQKPGTIDVIYASGNAYFDDDLLQVRLIGDVLNVPTRTYYTFVKYSDTNSDDGNTFADSEGNILISASEITEDKTYYARWITALDPIEFYHENDETPIGAIEYKNDPVADITIVVESQYPENPVLDEHHEFIGWSPKNEEGQLLGILINPDRPNPNLSINDLEGYRKDGHWIYENEEDGTIRVYSTFKKIDSTVTLLPNFDTDVDPQIVYIKNDATNIKDANSTYSPFAREHYALTGYYYNDTKIINADLIGKGTFVENAVDDQETPVNIVTDYKWSYVPNEITLKAKWEIVDTPLTLLPGDKAASTESIESWIVKDSTKFDGGVHSPSTGYKLKGYYDGDTLVMNPDKTFVKNVANYTDANGKWIHDPNSAVTLTAKWEQTTYTINFIAGSGVTGSIDPITNIKYFDTVTLTDINGKLSKTGWRFVGWSTSSGSEEIAYENKAQVSKLSNVDGATVNLYGVWIQDVEIIFESTAISGGTTSINIPTNVSFNDIKATYDARNIPTAKSDGWTLEGWYHKTGDETAEKIIDNSTGTMSFVANTSFTDENGKLNASPGTSFILTPVWKKVVDEGYVYVDHYTQGKQYLIVNKKEEVSSASAFDIYYHVEREGWPIKYDVEHWDLTTSTISNINEEGNFDISNSKVTSPTYYIEGNGHDLLLWNYLRSTWLQNDAFEFAKYPGKYLGPNFAATAMVYADRTYDWIYNGKQFYCAIVAGTRYLQFNANNDYSLEGRKVSGNNADVFLYEKQYNVPIYKYETPSK